MDYFRNAFTNRIYGTKLGVSNSLKRGLGSEMAAGPTQSQVGFVRWWDKAVKKKQLEQLKKAQFKIVAIAMQFEIVSMRLRDTAVTRASSGSTKLRDLSYSGRPMREAFY